jgi:hypothetical protein
MTVHNELDVVKVLSQHFCGGSKEKYKKAGKDSWCSGLDFKRSALEYKSETLLLKPTCLALFSYCPFPLPKRSTPDFRRISLKGFIKRPSCWDNLMHKQCRVGL